jgi:hypothetical protein
MRPNAATLIDRFELAFPIAELPPPAIDRYRMVPMTSLYLEVDYEDTDESEAFGEDDRATWRGDSGVLASSDVVPQSDRYLRARCWVSEE